MGIIAELDRAEDRVHGMAVRLGADLTTEFAVRPGTAAEHYRALLVRCAGCSRKASCEQLQAAHDTLDAAPDYCRNADTLHAAR